jgi:hypothetical protein
MTDHKFLHAGLALTIIFIDKSLVRDDATGGPRMIGCAPIILAVGPTTHRSRAERTCRNKARPDREEKQATRRERVRESMFLLLIPRLSFHSSDRAVKACVNNTGTKTSLALGAVVLKGLTGNHRVARR